MPVMETSHDVTHCQSPIDSIDSIATALALKLHACRACQARPHAHTCHEGPSRLAQLSALIAFVLGP